MVDVNELVEFKNHTFKLRDDEEQAKLRESIQENGIMEPAIVFENEEEQIELVSGHRRRKACIDLGIEKMPVLLKNLTRDEAIIIMGETNLKRREKILPSEKANTYKEMLEAMKRQGKRADLTSAPEEQKLTSREKLAKKFNEGSEQIRRYIRLTYLNPELLKLVDDGKIGFRPAVELSYLSSAHQETIYEIYETDGKTPSHAQAIEMRRLAKDSLLDEQVIRNIMSVEKPNQKSSHKLSEDFMSRYFPDNTDMKYVERRLEEALELLLRQEKIKARKKESFEERSL